MADQPYIESSVPSLEHLRQYLAGTLSEEARARLEAEMADSPLLADALEGLAAVEDAARMDQRLSRLRSQTRQRLASLEPVERPKPSSRRQSRIQPKLNLNMAMAVAAALALLLASTYLFYNLRQPEAQPTAVPQAANSPAPAPETPREQLAMAEEAEATPEPVTAPPPVPKPRTRAVPSQAGPAPEPTQAEPTQMPEPGLLSQREVADNEAILEDTPVPPTLSPSPQAAPVLAPEPAPSRVAVAEEPLTPGIVLEEEMRPAADESPASGKQVRASALVPPSLAEAEAAMTAGDFVRAQSLLEALTAGAEATNPQAWLWLAEVHLAQDQPAAALDALAQMPDQPEMAATRQWRTYQAHAAAGHTRRAQRLLAEIAATPGPYQAEAQRLLEQE